VRTLLSGESVTIFKTDSIGDNMEIVYAFGNEGQNPGKTRFTQFSNGKFYGIINGGKYKLGALFGYDPYNNKYTVS